jgi:hexosaminidase
MPVPASTDFGDGHLTIDSTFRAALTGYSEPRLERAVARMVQRLSRQTGIYLGMAPPSASATLTIECDGRAAEVQSAVEDESYELVVTAGGARLHAPTPYGVLHGIETFLQLIRLGEEGFQVPAVTIEDHPRFPWRGLLIDVARHWIPPEVVKRNLDGMAAVKMNVLHWHLTEDQGFRVESKRFPQLHELGSDGKYLTQDEVREIIEYARDRGIRVVPEFDMPGHATSWFVAHPELASAPGPYEIERSWGIRDPAMDPTREEVYELLDAFIGEMAGLFPDPYFHIGGDEVTGVHWDANPEIQAFIRERGMEDNHDLQAYFNRRIQEILSRYGKKMVGWDEIFHPALPRDIVIQSWRGQESLAESARQGYQGILSNGYYLDHILSAGRHYQVDPLSGAAADLSPGERTRVLGGEACMWSEFVTWETIDSRIWPRAAAIAERLWSPAEVDDAEDMYRRLEVTSQRLELLGLTHRSSYQRMLRRLTNYGPIDALKTLADVLEPVKYYERPGSREYTGLMPLNRLVDATRPESDVAREFSQMVHEMLADPSHKHSAGPIEAWLVTWRDNHERVLPVIQASASLREAEPLSANLRDLAEVGLEALAKIRRGRRLRDSRWAELLEVLERTAQPRAELLIMVEPTVRKLVAAAHERR